MDELNNSVSLLEISPPMTKHEADKLLEEVYQLDKRIKARECERDGYISDYKSEIARYEDKIAIANEQCEADNKGYVARRASLVEVLKRFTEANISDKSKTIKTPTASMSLVKRQPKFFTADNKEVNGNNEWLIEFVKGNAPALLKRKVTESVDWIKLKGMLTTDDGVVFFTETGEVIAGLHAQELPDDFKIKFHVS